MGVADKRLLKQFLDDMHEVLLKELKSYIDSEMNAYRQGMAVQPSKPCCQKFKDLYLSLNAERRFPIEIKEWSRSHISYMGLSFTYCPFCGVLLGK